MMGDSRPVGLIGLGLIGTVIARRLLAAGHQVAGYDIDEGARARLKSMGGVAVDSIAAIGSRCDRMFIAVFDTSQVEDVIEGPSGLLSVAAPTEERIAINISTCDPDRMAALSERAGLRGLTFVEMPISGTSQQIASGDGVGLLGGDRAVLASIEPLLRVICPSCHVVGLVGAGAKAKLAINLILGLNRAALAEGLAFADCLGLDLASFLKVARGSAAYSQIMDVKGTKMIEREFSAQGRIVQSLKDFGIIHNVAANAGQALPIASIYVDLLEGCIRSNEGDWDNSAIIEEVRRRRVALADQNATPKQPSEKHVIANSFRIKPDAADADV